MIVHRTFIGPLASGAGLRSRRFQVRVLGGSYAFLSEVILANEKVWLLCATCPRRRRVCSSPWRGRLCSARGMSDGKNKWRSHVNDRMREAPQEGSNGDRPHNRYAQERKGRDTDMFQPAEKKWKGRLPRNPATSAQGGFPGTASSANISRDRDATQDFQLNGCDRLSVKLYGPRIETKRAGR